MHDVPTVAKWSQKLYFLVTCVCNPNTQNVRLRLTWDTQGDVLPKINDEQKVNELTSLLGGECDEQKHSRKNIDFFRKRKMDFQKNEYISTW